MTKSLILQRYLCGSTKLELNSKFFRKCFRCWCWIVDMLCIEWKESLKTFWGSFCMCWLHKKKITFVYLRSIHKIFQTLTGIFLSRVALFKNPPVLSMLQVPATLEPCEMGSVIYSCIRHFTSNWHLYFYIPKSILLTGRDVKPSTRCL